MFQPFSIVLLVLGVLVLVFSIFIAILVHVGELSPEQGQVYAQINLVLLTVMILLIYYRQTQVLSNQEKIMSEQTRILGEQVPVLDRQTELMAAQTGIVDTQTKLLKLEKKPILAIRKTYDGGLWSFEVENLSKYPILIEDIDFKPHINSEEDQAVKQVIKQIINEVQSIKGEILSPGQKKEFQKSSLSIPGILRIKVSNPYYRDLVLEYEFDVGLGKMRLLNYS
ncbi:hypothetical protein DRP05_10175 [Archaeoglobales archaeon]|nr:MAG: hypothetical protein DRP05_10175 [Archaeoglobales archaeon]